MESLEYINKKCINETDNELLSIIEKLNLQVNQLIANQPEVLLELEKYNGVLNHYDLHPHNLLFKDEELVSLIDLDSFVVVPFKLAASFGLFKLFRKSVSHRELILSEICPLLHRYFNHHFDLKLYSQIELIRRSILILDLKYRNNDIRWLSDLNKHIIGLEEAEKIFG
jgi:hypothetical protein